MISFAYSTVFLFFCHISGFPSLLIPLFPSFRVFFFESVFGFICVLFDQLALLNTISLLNSTVISWSLLHVFLLKFREFFSFICFRLLVSHFVADAIFFSLDLVHSIWMTPPPP